MELKGVAFDKSNLPSHIAIIMDGNGRWAQQKGEKRIYGHQNAIEAVRDVTEGCAELGIAYLTLYAFSTENWRRPQHEINALMTLLVNTIKSETPTLTKNNVSLSAIGAIDTLPEDCQKGLEETIQLTKGNNGLKLILALSYSGRWELVNAAKNIAKDFKEGKITSINDDTINHYLATSGIPDPELLIRTSGEKRISNFLLWQIAYSELYFTDILWPDFRKNNLYEAIVEYQQRERRFGELKIT